MSLHNLKQYFAGSALSVGIIILSLLGVEIITIFVNPEPYSIFDTVFFLLKILPHIVGGYLAGYLVTKKIAGDHIIIGITTAVLTYIIEVFYFAILGNKTLSDIWIMGVLVISNVAGSFRAKTQFNKQNPSQKEIVETS
ncbi:hypothetical protein FJY84_02240 [Candidatus Bathyarchaeota archaeon]|nr:hypothetical protein [Candidatus Bathyarchaeota archaeon]